MTDQEAAAASIEQQVMQMKSNASQLREQVKAAFASARQLGVPEAYREALVTVRSLQDTLEEYVAFAVSLKGGMARAAADAREAYDGAWSAEATRNSNTAVRRGEEMEGPRERYARFDVKVFEQLRGHRQAEKRLMLVSELLDEIQLRYRAVNATREDLHQIMRSFVVERSIER